MLQASDLRPDAGGNALLAAGGTGDRLAASQTSTRRRIRQLTQCRNH